MPLTDHDRRSVRSVLSGRVPVGDRRVPGQGQDDSAPAGPGFRVEASVGHVRDLPNGSAQVPAEYRDQPWGRLGVNVEDDFTPIYVVAPDKRSKVADLRKHLRG